MLDEHESRQLYERGPVIRTLIDLDWAALVALALCWLHGC